MTANVLDSLGEKRSMTTGKGLARAQEILLAARDILMTDGYAGLSMRGVAAKVNVSLSNVQHYYKSKEALVEALLTYVMDEYQQRVAELMASMSGKTPQERFTATMEMFLQDIRRPDVRGIFTELWALANRIPFAVRLVEEVQTRERKEVFNLIRGLKPSHTAAESKLRAALIVAQIHGLLVLPPSEEETALYGSRLVDAARQSFLKLATMA